MAYVGTVNTLPVTNIDGTIATFNGSYYVYARTVCFPVFRYYTDGTGWRQTTKATMGVDGGWNYFSLDVINLKAGYLYHIMFRVYDIRNGRHNGALITFYTSSAPTTLHFRAWGKAGDGLIYTGEDNVLEWP